jgi:hypothetical protein
MPQHVPLSVTLSPDQIEWLDARRQQGNLTRSAALRVALDRLILQEEAQAHSGAQRGR